MYKYLQRGIRHERLNLLCQDAVCGRKKNGVMVVAAADASSENNYGRKGAEIVVETLLHLLLHHFNEIHEMRKNEIQYNIILQVRKKLYEFCQKEGIKLEEVKSTFMAFAYDKETKRVILLHLGDGYIVAKTKKGFRIISYPKNGGNPYRTYMTSTVPVGDKIHVYCGKMEELQEIFLITDGWREFFQTDEELPGILPKIKYNWWKGEDDLGLICLNLDDEKCN